jgi:hypothetical protein
MPDALDPGPLLRFLHQRGVEHIIVGGFAVNAHGFIRVTKDLDMVPRAGRENLARLADTLRDLDAQTLDTGDFDAQEMPMDATRVEDLEQGGNYCLHTNLGRLDVMQWLAGVEGEDIFAELAQEAIEGTVEDVPIRVCGLKHLLAMKRAAGRPQDLEDLRRLGA